jgi:hypothetical protein
MAASVQMEERLTGPCARPVMAKERQSAAGQVGIAALRPLIAEIVLFCRSEMSTSDGQHR